MRLADALRSGSELLKMAGVDEFELDARLLLEYVLDKSRTELYLAVDLNLSDSQFQHYQHLLERREKREPVAYILGEQEFWSLPFIVTPDVLIPRPETEFLLEQVLSRTKKSNFSEGRIIDLCCGSGIIATILAKELGQKIYGVDISPQALAVARINFERHGVKRNIHLVQSNLLGAFKRKQQFSLIVSNPPYVSHIDVINNLAPEVCDYEPHLALDGGERGLELIIIIREQLEYLLQPGGELFMEIGADQGEQVSTLFKNKIDDLQGFTTVEILKDYAGRDRVIHAIKSER
ncbi:MAG: release factor glutamine methyltransferase [Desulforhopalus sp.]|jgi:release factor glutamine methyltransferase